MSTITTPSRSDVDVDDDDDDEEELPGGVALLLLLVLLNRRPVAISIITGAMSTDFDVKCDHRLTTTTEFSCIFYIQYISLLILRFYSDSTVLYILLCNTMTLIFCFDKHFVMLNNDRKRRHNRTIIVVAFFI